MDVKNIDAWLTFGGRDLQPEMLCTKLRFDRISSVVCLFVCIAGGEGKLNLQTFCLPIKGLLRTPQFSIS